MNQGVKLLDTVALLEEVQAVAEHYEQEPERTERIAWQGGDIIEP